MSSPVAIPRVSRSAVDTHPGSASPTGLYVPIHKRTGSATSLSSEHSDVPPKAKRGRRAPRSSVEPAVAPRQTHISTKRPFVYDFADLLALSSSSLVGISTEQHAHVAQLLNFTAQAITANTSSADTPAEKSQTRRRRAGRRTSNTKKLAASVSADVESRRKRHGNWGWQAHAELEESWRHAPVAEVSA